MFNLLPASKAPHFTTEWDGVNAKVYLTKRIMFSLRSKNLNDYLAIIYSLLFNDTKLKSLIRNYIVTYLVSVEVKGDDERCIGYSYDNLYLDCSEGLLFQLLKLRALIDVIKVGFMDWFTK